MTRFLALVIIALISNVAFAQPAQGVGIDECQDMVALRDRSAGLKLAIDKIDLGVEIGVKNNSDLTSRFMTILLFESQICRLSKALVLKKQPPISSEQHEKWLNEIDNVYDKLDEAVDGKMPGEVKASFNRAKTALLSSWLPNGEKAVVYGYKLPEDVSPTFSSLSPAVNFTRDVSGSGYVKFLVTQGISAKYQSTMAKGDELVGNQLAAFERMRTFINIYAQGNTTASVMLRSIIQDIVSVADQLAGKRSVALLRDEIAANAEARQNSSLATKVVELERQSSSLVAKITDLEARFSKIEKK